MRVNMKHFEGLENEKTNLTELQMQYLINRGLAHTTQTPYNVNQLLFILPACYYDESRKQLCSLRMWKSAFDVTHIGYVCNVLPTEYVFSVGLDDVGEDGSDKLGYFIDAVYKLLVIVEQHKPNIFEEFKNYIETFSYPTED